MTMNKARLEKLRCLILSYHLETSAAVSKAPEEPFSKGPFLETDSLRRLFDPSCLDSRRAA